MQKGKLNSSGLNCEETGPVFYSEGRGQNVENLWCKINELRVFGWSEEATIHFALTKLKGLAEIR